MFLVFNLYLINIPSGEPTVTPYIENSPSTTPGKIILVYAHTTHARNIRFGLLSRDKNKLFKTLYICCCIHPSLLEKIDFSALPILATYGQPSHFLSMPLRFLFLFCINLFFWYYRQFHENFTWRGPWHQMIPEEYQHRCFIRPSSSSFLYISFRTSKASLVGYYSSLYKSSLSFSSSSYNSYLIVK